MSLLSELETIQTSLYKLRRGYFLKPGLICLAAYLLWGWFFLILYLAWGYYSWHLISLGLIPPVAYGSYIYFSRPDLDKMAVIVDRRCKLEQRLVTLWQYRHSQASVLSPLSQEVIQRLAKIAPSMLFPLKINRKIWVAPAGLLLLTAYLWRYPLHKAVSADPNAQNQPAATLTQVADQIEQFQRQLAQASPGDAEFQAHEAEQFKEVAKGIQELNDKKEAAAAARKLEVLKQRLADNLSPAASIPPVPQSLMDQIKAAPPEKRALLEFEVKSKHLIGLLKQMEKLGLNTDQIKSQFVRELFGLVDYLIQLKLPGSANQMTQVPAATGTAQVAQNTGGSGSSPPVDAARTGYDETGKLPMVVEDSPEDLPQLNPDQGWQSESSDMLPKLGNLSTAYRQRVQAILNNQDIPLTYRQQVGAYFDAINN